MIKKFVLLLVFLVLHIVVIQSISDTLYTPCSTNETLINYNINSNDIANFFTLYYPKNLIDNGTAISCQARFFTIVENHKIWMALYNGYTGDFIAFDDELNQFGQSFDSTNGIASFSSKTQSLTFKLNTLESNDWVAFEAVVIAYDPEIVQCPFSGQNISFFDSEKLIIPIASDFGQKTSDTNCQWTFRPSYRTYLKIVIQSLILNENIIFELKQNGTTIKRFDKNISKPEVYYFSADLGDLILYYSDTNDAISGNGFSALISEAIVPSSSLTEECPSMMKDNVLTVSNLDYEIGYKANQKCEYSIEVKENQEVFVEVTVFHIEKNVDKLSVIFEEFNYPLDEEDFNNILQVTSSANNSLISFEADSNIQQAGFEVTLRSFDCSCRDKDIIIPCTDPVEITPLGINELYYCDNMNCRYHISNDPTCSESLEDIYELNLSAEIREGHDYFNIYVDGILREKLDKSMIYKRYFPRELNITLEFISTSDSPIKNGDRGWELNLKNKISPPINSVTLNESKPLYIVDILGINEFDIISVCSPETDVLELFIASDKTSLQNYVLYDGSDYFGKLDSPEIFDENSQNFGRISSNTGCFEIQKTAEDLIHETGIFLFRMKNAQSKNCMNEKNIKILSSENTIFKSTANSEGDCEVIILSPKSPLFQFSIDFMTGTPNNIFTFKSPMNQNIFAEINSMEMSLWKNLRLYTPALSIILPPSTFFNTSARFGSDGIIKAEMDSQKGIMASPSYSDPNFLGSSGYSEPLFSIMSSNSTSVFTAELELQSKEGDNKVLIKVDFDSNDYYLQYPGEKLTVTGTRIHVEQYSANDKFLISYTLNPSQSSSTILTTTFNPSNPPSTVNPTNPPSTNPSITTSNPNTSTTTSYSNTSITTDIPTTTTSGSSANRISSSFLLFIFSLSMTSFIAFYF